MCVRSSKRLPRDSISMCTKAWLSFFHNVRFCPEREKENERYFGSVEPALPADLTDSGGRGGFCGLGAGDGPMKREKNPRFGVIGVLGDMLVGTGEFV
jgi:hypothetical protein